jgi:hypothetical protein
VGDQGDFLLKNNLFGLGSNIGHGLFVGWVEYPAFVGFRSSTQPTIQPFLFYQRNPTKWPKIEPSPTFLIIYPENLFLIVLLLSQRSLR